MPKCSFLKMTIYECSRTRKGKIYCTYIRVLTKMNLLFNELVFNDLQSGAYYIVEIITFCTTKSSEELDLLKVPYEN